NISSFAFAELLNVSDALFIETQSNQLLLTSLLYQYAETIYADTILFKDDFVSSINISNAYFRKRNESDIVFEHTTEPVGDYVVELNNEVAATGGFLLHYNMPFADLYMEVKPEHRRKGLGSFLLQEVKRECYLAGSVPAARTAIENIASQAALKKAGFAVAGYMLTGNVKR
ncbi:MAG TPA: GNAT family N-acetyltransferase, partial [Chitinophagaceae bacterium]|nr:GNAT family N-acetyltransferase [Chitinophagaceae bacterium]